MPGGTVYFDSSALVKRYVREPGSEYLLDLLTNPRGTLFVISRLVPLEIASAVTRRSRAGDLAPEQASALLDAMREDIASRFRIYEVSQRVWSRAEALISTHALRAADSIHLATTLIHAASISERVTFACADQPLLAAAGNEGLLLWDPNIGDLQLGKG